MNQLAEGVRAPDFELKTIDGRGFRLSHALGTGPVVLAFYKASCPTCQFTFPYLQRIFERRGNVSAARLLGISQDETAETEELVDRLGISFDVLIDDHPYEVSASYGLEYVPAIFAIDTQGIVQVSDYGFSKAALSSVATILAENAGVESVPIFSPDDGIPATRPG